MRLDETGTASGAVRVSHDKGELTTYLRSLPAGTPVAVETTGYWYWLLDEIEKASLKPQLAHALAAKRTLVSPNKTDKLDAKGLATLLRNGTLPEVWAPSGDLRAVRGLMRSRLAARRFSTALKNRITAALARRIAEPREAAQRGWQQNLAALPRQTRLATEHEWNLLQEVEGNVEQLNEQIGGSVGKLGWVRRLRTLPGIGEIWGRRCIWRSGMSVGLPRRRTWLAMRVWCRA